MSTYNSQHDSDPEEKANESDSASGSGSGSASSDSSDSGSEDEPTIRGPRSTVVKTSRYQEKSQSPAHSPQREATSKQKITEYSDDEEEEDKNDDNREEHSKRRHDSSDDDDRSSRHKEKKRRRERDSSMEEGEVEEDYRDRRSRRNRSRDRGGQRRRSRDRRDDRSRDRSRHDRDPDREKNIEKRREERKLRHAKRDEEEQRSRDKQGSGDRNGDDSARPRKRQVDDEEVKADNGDTSKGDEEYLTKKKARATADDTLTTKTGGAYIPPARLRMMQANITDKSSAQYQRIAWEALKKSINGLINKVNVSNLVHIVQELFQENVVRGRGLLSRSVIQAQAASPTFTHVYAALVAIINTKFPQIGELILKRLSIQFKKGFRRNDKTLCLSSVKFVAHLVNQQVAHEILSLEILTLLLENPSDDSVEVAVGFLKEVGQKLTEVSPKGIHAIFDRLRNALHEGAIDLRVQYMIEVMFAVRKDGFKDHPSVLEELDLVEESEQFTHMLTLEDAVNTEDMLNVFKLDPEYEENEEKYIAVKKDILDEDSSGSGSGSGSGSDGDTSEEEGAEENQVIIDKTETNLVALRRTIYLTIQSSLDFEECAHKLLKMEMKPGQESELCNMILDCCGQQRTYEKFFGLLAQRFCMLDKKFILPFQSIFSEQYETIHQLETNKLRNVGKFFSHLLHTDAISWEVVQIIHLNEEETTSSSRIFIKIMFQELSEYMGLPKLNTRLKDATLQPCFEGLLPRDNPKNTRFAINFFTSIGLGGLTDDLRSHLKTMPKAVPQMLPESSSSESSDSSSSSSSSSSSDDSSSSSDSDDSSDDEPKKRKKSKRAWKDEIPHEISSKHDKNAKNAQEREDKASRRHRQRQAEAEREEEEAPRRRHKEKKKHRRREEDSGSEDEGQASPPPPARRKERREHKGREEQARRQRDVSEEEPEPSAHREKKRKKKNKEKDLDEEVERVRETSIRERRERSADGQEHKGRRQEKSRERQREVIPSPEPEQRRRKRRDQTPDLIRESRHSQRSPDTKGRSHRSPDNKGHQQRSPDNKGRPQRSPDNKGRQQRSPDNRGRPQGSPDNKGRQQRSPDNRGRQQRSPDNRGRPQGSPDNKGRQQRSPDNKGRQQRSPDNKRRQQRSPDNRGRPQRSPDNKGRQQRSPDARDNRREEERRDRKRPPKRESPEPQERRSRQDSSSDASSPPPTKGRHEMKKKQDKKRYDSESDESPVREKPARRERGKKEQRRDHSESEEEASPPREERREKGRRESSPPRSRKSRGEESRDPYERRRVSPARERGREGRRERDKRR